MLFDLHINFHEKEQAKNVLSSIDLMNHKPTFLNNGIPHFPFFFAL